MTSNICVLACHTVPTRGTKCPPSGHCTLVITQDLFLARRGTRKPESYSDGHAKQTRSQTWGLARAPAIHALILLGHAVAGRRALPASRRVDDGRWRKHHRRTH